MKSFVRPWQWIVFERKQTICLTSSQGNYILIILTSLISLSRIYIWEQNTYEALLWWKHMYSIDMQFVENISVADFIHVRKHKRKNKPAAV